MGLAIFVTLWALTTGLTLFAVQRWHLIHWDPLVVGVTASEGGPYRSAPTVPQLRYGAPWLVRAVATLAIAVFWAFLPALGLSGSFGFAWLLLSAFPLGGAAILLRSEARWMVILLTAVWVQMAALMVAAASPPPGFDALSETIPPTGAVWVTGPLMALVAAASLIRRGPKTVSSATDDPPRSIRVLRWWCMCAWLIHLPLSAWRPMESAAVLGFFMGLPIAIGSLLINGRPRLGVGIMFGIWVALAFIAVTVAVTVQSGVLLVPVALTGPSALAMTLKNRHLL